jgi:hypothetical protein
MISPAKGPLGSVSHKVFTVGPACRAAKVAPTAAKGEK